MPLITVTEKRLTEAGYKKGAGGQWYHNVTHFGVKGEAFNSDNHVHIIGKNKYVGVSNTGTGGSAALDVEEIELKFDVNMWTFGDEDAPGKGQLYRVWLSPNAEGKFTYDWQRVSFKGRKMTAQQVQIANGLWSYVPEELKA